MICNFHNIENMPARWLMILRERDCEDMKGENKMWKLFTSRNGTYKTWVHLGLLDPGWQVELLAKSLPHW